MGRPTSRTAMIRCPRDHCGGSLVWDDDRRERVCTLCARDDAELVARAEIARRAADERARKARAVERHGKQETGTAAPFGRWLGWGLAPKAGV